MERARATLSMSDPCWSGQVGMVVWCGGVVMWFGGVVCWCGGVVMWFGGVVCWCGGVVRLLDKLVDHYLQWGGQ